jgi:ribosomal protein S27E
MERGEKEPIQVLCPKCRHTEIIYLPVEDLPRCPECGNQMIIEELLDEGKSY